MRKPAFCICENKGADQLGSNCAADQHLCFRYIENAIPLLPKSGISSLLLLSVAVQPSLCRTWSGDRFSHGHVKLLRVASLEIVFPLKKIWQTFSSHLNLAIMYIYPNQ